MIPVAGKSSPLIGLSTQYRLDYEYDDQIWWEMDNQPRDLVYTLYLEDHLPVEGKVPFLSLMQPTPQPSPNYHQPTNPKSRTARLTLVSPRCV